MFALTNSLASGVDSTVFSEFVLPVAKKYRSLVSKDVEYIGEFGQRILKVNHIVAPLVGDLESFIEKLEHPDDLFVLVKKVDESETTVFLCTGIQEHPVTYNL
jgi:hypothetical protein